MKRRKVQAHSGSGTLKSSSSQHILENGAHSARPRLSKPKLAPRPPTRKVGALSRIFRPATLSPERVRFAYTVAVFGDVIQLAIGLFSSNLPAETATLLTVLPAAVVAVLLVPTLGLHVLLLPTLILEVIPAVNTLPAWTACVALVVALRKK